MPRYSLPSLEPPPPLSKKQAGSAGVSGPLDSVRQLAHPLAKSTLAAHLTLLDPRPWGPCPPEGSCLFDPLPLRAGFLRLASKRDSFSA